jgi:hypothetical protein
MISALETVNLHLVFICETRSKFVSRRHISNIVLWHHISSGGFVRNFVRKFRRELRREVSPRSFATKFRQKVALTCSVAG